MIGWTIGGRMHQFPWDLGEGLALKPPLVAWRSCHMHRGCEFECGKRVTLISMSSRRMDFRSMHCGSAFWKVLCFLVLEKFFLSEIAVSV